MSKSAIKVNDLVMVVKNRQCCGMPNPSPNLGKVFVVTNIEKTISVCPFCAHEYYGIHVDYKKKNERETGFRIDRLIKIDPPSINESEEHVDLMNLEWKTA